MLRTRLTEQEITERDLPRTTCDICGHLIEAGERRVDSDGEIAHATCVSAWFRNNFGREGLA